MPQRTNTFQQVVRLVHEHLAADGASVKESHMLVDEITGEDREVDATTRKRPADASGSREKSPSMNHWRQTSWFWFPAQASRRRWRSP
jgi:hypothetical protein